MQRPKPDIESSPFHERWQEFAWRGAMIPARHGAKVLGEGSAVIDRRGGAMDGALASCRAFATWPWGEGLYLTGEVGCGKTLLAVCTVRAMILTARYASRVNVDWSRNDVPAFLRQARPNPAWHPDFRFVNTPKLLTAIKNTFSRMSASEPSTTSVIEEYLTTDVLVLDDIGAEKATDWVREQLFLILDDRYQARRPTIITSNLPLGELASVLSMRVADRILEMCKGNIVKITCGSYR